MRGKLLAAGFGVQPVRYRQSSSALAAVCRVGFAFCAQRFPNWVASRTPVHGSGGWGAFQRKGPTGAFAYGIPRYAKTAPSLRPRSGPLVTVTGGAPPSPA